MCDEFFVLLSMVLSPLSLRFRKRKGFVFDSCCILSFICYGFPIPFSDRTIFSFSPFYPPLPPHAEKHRTAKAIDKTKQGISLSVEQFNTLISFLPHIETVLVHKYGERDLARPSYSPREGDGDTRTSKGAGAEDAKEAKEEKYDDIDDEVADDSSERKKNFEATSDEE